MNVRDLERHAVGRGLKYKVLTNGGVFDERAGDIVTTYSQDSDGHILFTKESGDHGYMSGRTQIEIYSDTGDDLEDHF